MIHAQLRAMEPEDLDLLYKIENDVKLWNVSATNVPYSRYVLHDYIAHSSGDIYTDKQVRLIIENECGKTIGMVDIVNFAPQHQRAELGIVIQEQFRGKGYGKAVVQEVLKYAKHVLHLHQIYVVVAVDKGNILALFAQLGFTEGCRLADWLYDGTAYRDAVLMQYIFSAEEEAKNRGEIK